MLFWLQTYNYYTVQFTAFLAAGARRSNPIIDCMFESITLILRSVLVGKCRATVGNSKASRIVDVCTEHKVCFKRRASHVPNALKTIDNQLKCLIIYCFCDVVLSLLN